MKYILGILLAIFSSKVYCCEKTDGSILEEENKKLSVKAISDTSQPRKTLENIARFGKCCLLDEKHQEMLKKQTIDPVPLSILNVISHVQSSSPQITRLDMRDSYIGLRSINLLSQTLNSNSLKLLMEIDLSGSRRIKDASIVALNFLFKKEDFPNFEYLNVRDTKFSTNYRYMGIDAFLRRKKDLLLPQEQWIGKLIWLSSNSISNRDARFKLQHEKYDQWKKDHPLNPCISQEKRFELMDGMYKAMESTSAENLKKALVYSDMLYPRKDDRTKAIIDKSIAGDDSEWPYLAYRYKSGTGLAVNLEKAFYWYKKSRSTCDPDTLQALANMYRYGEGTEKDERKAEEILEGIKE